MSRLRKFPASLSHLARRPFDRLFSCSTARRIRATGLGFVTKRFQSLRLCTRAISSERRRIEGTSEGQVVNERRRAETQLRDYTTKFNEERESRACVCVGEGWFLNRTNSERKAKTSTRSPQGPGHLSVGLFCLREVQGPLHLREYQGCARESDDGWQAGSCAGRRRSRQVLLSVKPGYI
jgi:hypothetical protein